MADILAPAIGTRIAKLLAVETKKHVSPDFTMILVRRQVEGSEFLQHPKIGAAYRVVDICPEDSELLRTFIDDRSGLLGPWALCARSKSPVQAFSQYLLRIATANLYRFGSFPKRGSSRARESAPLLKTDLFNDPNGTRSGPRLSCNSSMIAGSIFGQLRSQPRRLPV